MSLYAMVVGRHPLAGLLLERLGFESEAEVRRIPRLRDVYLYQDEIRVLTRTGGGNRDEYEEGNDWIRARPGFLRDWDDPYDNTYAWWSFAWPEADREGLQLVLDELIQRRPELLPDSTRERFEAALERIGKPGEKA